MMSYRRLIIAGVLGAAFGAAWTAPASAYVVTLDNFKVQKNGGAFFDDPFTDGVPPPSAPNFANGNPASYVGTGVTSVSEAGGRAILNTGLGAPGFNPQNVGQFPILATNIDPANLTLGLKSNSTIKVEGLFDLVLPPGNGDRYGIRLTDRFTGAGPVPPPQPGDDVLEVGVRRGTDGILRVQYRQIGFGVPTINIASVVLAPGLGDDQILLRLERASLLSTDVTASFDLLDGGVVTSSALFLTAGNPDATIFNGENWTRAQFVATEQVPEPGTLALLGLGLIPLVTARRRRRAA